METGKTPTTKTYEAHNTALLIIDPYNDFMTEGGKMYAATKSTADSVGYYENMRKLIPAIRESKIQIFIVPHHRAHKDKTDLQNWKHPSPPQTQAVDLMLFGVDTWGGEWNEEFGPKAGDVIVKEHWLQNGFANTDLDMLLKQHGIEKIIVVGFIANSCVEATARYGVELGYHVTLVPDATAAFNQEGMDAARANSPLYVHVSLLTNELLAELPKANNHH